MPAYRSLLLIPTLLLAAPAMAAPAAPAATTTEQQWVLPADGPYEVSLENLQGRVVVRGWNKNVVYLKATKRAARQLGEAERAIYTALKAGQGTLDGAKLAAKTDWGAETAKHPAVQLVRTPNVQVDYELLVPPEVAVRIQQQRGDVIAYGVDGRLMIDTKDGEVTVSGAKGRVEVSNERGNLRFSDIDGDVVASSQHGKLDLSGVTGDIRAKSLDGDITIAVPPRFAGEISFHTVSGLIRSDLSTALTDLEPGDKGYVGVLRGPLAGAGAPEARLRIDTVSGTTVIANERPRWR